MTLEDTLSVRIDLTMADFDRRIEEEFKPVLQAAIADVMAEFLADTVGKAIVVVGEEAE